jgi:putative DNA primase/helicase
VEVYYTESQHNSHARADADPPLVKRLNELPEALRNMRRWMGTRLQPRKGKPGKLDKPPHRVVSGRPIIKAGKTDPENWATFPEALAALKREAVDAIGFVITDDDDDDEKWGADLDDVIDPETGEIHPNAVQVIHALNTYTEISCSGRGIHIIGMGRKPEGAGCKSKTLGFNVELYDGHSANSSGARFLVMTGNRYPGTPPDVEERQAELEKLCRELWPPKKKRQRQPGEASEGINLDDGELLDRARRSRTGAKFRALYDRGDTGRYASQSEADFALINSLIFWAGGDRERIIDLFCASALYRDSEAGKHRNYVTTSVDNALSSYSGSYYRPRRARASAKPEDRDPLKPYLRLLLDPPAWRGKRGASAYKAAAALVAHSTERGVIDDDGNLRVRVDTRTLAETAGMSRSTLTDSALPYLLKELKILKWWAPPRGEKTGGYVLLAENVKTMLSRSNRLSTLPIGTSEHGPEEALETLRLLIRMRGGKSKIAPLARLGMLAMFCAVAYCTAGSRGYTDEELAKRTGRPAYALRRKGGPIERLFVADIIEETGDRYRLTPDFRAEWERELKESGIKRAERQQRWWHSEDRRKRAEKMDKRRAKKAEEELKRSRQKRAEEMDKQARPMSELRVVPDPDPALVEALRRALIRWPDHADDYASWWASSLHVEGWLPYKPDARAVEVALHELRRRGAGAA